MASIRTTAQGVLEEARDGIAWIALYKQGRGWGASCFWPDLGRNGELTFDPDDLEELKEILHTDENAVLLNGYSAATNVEIVEPAQDVKLDRDKVITLGAVTVTIRRE